MNLWVKRTGQLLLAALFLMACEDESSLLGFKNPIGKFDVKYIEIPVTGSMFLMDSVRTSNFAGETSRLLVGEHSDPKFGTIKAIGFSHVLPTTTASIDGSALVDSVVLHIRLDYYLYGAAGISDQFFSIHELTEQLYFDSVANYISSRTITYDPAPLGTTVKSVSKTYFNEQFQKANNQKDTTILKVVLNNSFGSKLLARAIAGDSTYTRSSEFTKFVKGLAIVPTLNDKIIGLDLNNVLNAASRLSNLVVYYHTIEKDSLQLNFSLNGVQFTRFEVNRAGSDLNALTSFYQEISPVNDLLYTQNGTGVITKLDFTNFVEFSEANPAMIINSAELVIQDLESDPEYDPPLNFNLHVLKENNRFRKARTIIKNVWNKTIRDSVPTTITDPRDVADVAKYNGTVTTISDGSFAVVSDLNTVFTLQKSSGNSYGGFLTLLTQQLYELDKKNKEPFRYFGLFPVNPQNGKSLNRIIFHKDDIVLRVYYTLPTVNE